MSTTPTSVPCVVESTYFPHLLLVPAGIIITILAFLRRRRSYRNDLCGGRPGLVVPLDILGIDNDRLAIMCVFGAATGSILGLINNSVQGRNAWEIAFHGIGNTLEVAFLYYPYFGCLASYHRIIGALMGLPYAVVYFSVGMTTDLQECNNLENWKQYVFKMLPKIPTIICQLFILGKFVVVLYQEIRDYGICGVRLFSQNDEHASHQVKLIRPWLLNHVKDLINSKPRRQYSGIVFYLRKIYNPEENFKFSTLTVSVVIICMILMYNISIQVVFLAGVSLNAINKVSTGQIGDVFRGVLACLVAGTVLAVLFCVVSFIRFMENHKNNMLRMFKGDKSFIPKNISASQFMIGKGLRYHSYQIGYFLWGFALLILLLFLICCAFYSLSFEYVQDKIVGFLKGGAVISGVALLTGLMLPLTSFTVFRDYNYSKDVISVNNRNVYLVFSYFWFFLGLPMGFLSAISRILKSMAVGALMLPRIDHSVMPDGFQQLDPGFNAYICYLHVQAAYRNPVLRVFCQILSDGTTKRKGQKWTCSAQARARWFLALTLDRNPQLVPERRPDVLAPELPVQYDPDVKIEVGKYGSDNVGLIQNE